MSNPQPPRKPIDFIDLEIMTRTIWGEARGETMQGRRAVGCVIINRWRSGKWFNGIDANNDGAESVAEVCQQPYQFSGWNKHDPNLPKLLAVRLGDKTFGECLVVANMVIEDSMDARYAGRDPSNGACHYYVSAGPAPKWSFGKKPCAIIGAHSFFNNIS